MGSPYPQLLFIPKFVHSADTWTAIGRYSSSNLSILRIELQPILTLLMVVIEGAQFFDKNSKQ